ncbi:MAG: hypothetical protein JNJ94_09830, partial [Chlorobi bacterium]|nr:hypothetical protein [Chlorobiota bacterium]
MNRSAQHAFLIGLLGLAQLPLVTAQESTGDLFGRKIILDDGGTWPNGSFNTITLQAPSNVSLSGDYSLTLPPNTGTADYLLRTDGAGILTWVDPGTLLTGSYVRYNVASAQTTAGSGSRLFDVAYSGLGSGVAALGARIAAESGANANAGGLSIRATANGTGTSTGLSVEASGGATNYAGLFTSGKVGIGTATPISHVEVVA